MMLKTDLQIESMLSIAQNQLKATGQGSSLMEDTQLSQENTEWDGKVGVQRGRLSWCVH